MRVKEMPGTGFEPPIRFCFETAERAVTRAPMTMFFRFRYAKSAVSSDIVRLIFRRADRLREIGPWRTLSRSPVR
jgi:hypothetical protein